MLHWFVFKTESMLVVVIGPDKKRHCMCSSALENSFPRSLSPIININEAKAIILTLLFSQASPFHTPLLIIPLLYWTTSGEWIPWPTTRHTGPSEGRCAEDSPTSIKDDRLNH